MACSMTECQSYWEEEEEASTGQAEQLQTTQEQLRQVEDIVLIVAMQATMRICRGWVARDREYFPTLDTCHTRPKTDSGQSKTWMR